MVRFDISVIALRWGVAWGLLGLVFSPLWSQTEPAAPPAGEIRYCGQPAMTQKLFERHPHLHVQAEGADAQLEWETRNFVESGNRDEIIVIPMVFHIIHNNGPENISDEQVYSALEVLNRDFRLLNPDASTIVSDFAGIASDVEIEFRLAQKDPSGNCHSGINRVVSALTYDGSDAVKDLIYWPRNKYLNIWVVENASGAAGYTYLPGSVSGNQGAGIDGIVVNHDYTGNIGTSNNYRSRTLTHECGHWMNLRHTWGNGNEPGLDSNCDQDDLVSDTPNTIGWVACNLDGESCGSLDNIQNYMEYSYCSRMFTEGQRTRMRAAMNSSTAQRNQLWTAANLAATGTNGTSVLCAADFSTSRRTICVGDSVQFQDESYHGVTSWAWDFGDGNGVSGTGEGAQSPWHTYTEPGIYDVSLTVGNGIATLTGTETGFIQVLDAGEMPLPVAEGFESGLLPTTWYVVDEGGDGLTWQLTSTAAATGTRSLLIQNWSNTSEFAKEQLISSTMDMSNASEIVVSYKWAYSFKGNNASTDDTDDRLKVYASSDCGKTWVLRRMHRGFTDLPTAPPHVFPFVPADASEWISHTLVLPQAEYFTPNFRLLFEFESRLGNNLYLDDINIMAPGAVGLTDLSGAAFAAPMLMPNPSLGETACWFGLAQQAPVVVEVWDASGRLVHAMDAGTLGAGMHQLTLSPSWGVPGLYWVRVVAAGSPGRPAQWLVQ